MKTRRWQDEKTRHKEGKKEDQKGGRECRCNGGAGGREREGSKRGQTADLLIRYFQKLNASEIVEGIFEYVISNQRLEAPVLDSLCL